MEKYNHEHYSDPTPRDALGKVMKDQAELEAIGNVVQVIVDIRFLRISSHTGIFQRI